MNREKSKKAYELACQKIPGGVNSAARAFGAVGGGPIFIENAKGAMLTDVDGNQYIDYIGSWGPMLFGHIPDPVLSAIQNALTSGTSFGAPTLAETELATLIGELMPAAEKVRLVNSGTEATMSALRVARGATGREKIVKFIGNYHGHVDSLLVAAGSAAATLSVPNSPGVTQGTSRDTILCHYNDQQALTEIFQNEGDQIAGVIFEPVCGNMGCVIPTEPFLDALHSLTKQYGSLLIVDEVMTGFRVASGGAQELFEIQPDLIVMGKVVGGGMPLAAFAGRKEIMDHVLPAGKVYQAGTLSGNPIATAAGIAALKMIQRDPPYGRLEKLAARLESGLLHQAEKHGMQVTTNRVGSMMTLFFSDQEIESWRQAESCDTEMFSKFFWHMMDRGVYLPCSQFEALFVSDAHTTQMIDNTIKAAGESFELLSNQ